MAAGPYRSPNGRSSACGRKQDAGRKLRELVQFGEENDAIGERVHRAALAMIKRRIWKRCYRFSTTTCARTLQFRMCIPVLERSGSFAIAEFGPASEEVRVFADSLNHPYCSGKPMFETGRGSARRKPS